MIILLVGLTLFFSAHLYSAFRARSPESAFPERIGRPQYRAGYSLIAALGLTAICFGFAETRAMAPIYTAPDWARTGAYGLMLPALILTAAAYLPSGLLRHRLNHPMLVGIGLWSASHLLSGANLPKLLLFSSFLAFSVIDFVAASKRHTEEPAPDRPPSARFDVIAAGLGLAAYLVVLVWLHRLVLGIDLLAG